MGRDIYKCPYSHGQPFWCMSVPNNPVVRHSRQKYAVANELALRKLLILLTVVEHWCLCEEPNPSPVRHYPYYTWCNSLICKQVSVYGNLGVHPVVYNQCEYLWQKRGVFYFVRHVPSQTCYYNQYCRSLQLGLCMLSESLRRLGCLTKDSFRLLRFWCSSLLGWSLHSPHHVKPSQVHSTKNAVTLTWFRDMNIARPTPVD